MQILFINGSPNRKGNTAALAETAMNRFAKLYGMEYAGMATDRSEAKKLGRTI